MSDDALQAALEERNRLWEELQSRQARDVELEYWRARATAMESSLSWQLTAPLRLALRALANPLAALRAVARRLRAWRGA